MFVLQYSTTSFALLLLLIIPTSMLVSHVGPVSTLWDIPGMTKNSIYLFSFSTVLRIVYNPRNSPIYNECQAQSAQVLALPRKWAHQDDSNDSPQPIGDRQVGFSLLRIRIDQDNP